MRIALVVLVSLLLAGCTGDTPPADAPPAGSANATLPPAMEDGPPRQEQPRGEALEPEWVPGQWWRYTVEHSLLGTWDVTTVVVAVNPGQYTVGWAELEPGLRSLAPHLPPVGAMTRPDLGSWRHGQTVTYAQFPLADGKTWQATYRDWDLSYTARISPSSDGQTPRFDIAGVDAAGVRHIEATYDAGALNFLRIAWGFDLDDAPIAVATMTERGSGHRGTVHVPTPSDLLDLSAQGPDPEAQDAGTGPLQGTFDAGSDLGAVVTAHFLGGGDGAYLVGWQPPAGDPQLVEQLNPPGDATIRGAVTAHTADFEGPWRVSAEAIGPGFIVVEAMGVVLTTADL